ncbi:MAG: flagellar M-ring protein FliF [Lachnospiraceae bacterium]|nr:flagellar M-ring protein FliF [Lachnospiraceae bacterium]
MANLQERLRALLQRFLDWWNRFTARQKTMIISAAVGVLVLIVIVVAILTQPHYKTLYISDTTKETSEVTAVLDENNITYETSQDGLTISVLEEQYTDAVILLGANNYPAAEYSIDSVFEGGFSSTESDKTKKYQEFMEQKFQSALGNMDNVKRAIVNINVPENNGTLLSKEKESYASVMLELENPEDMTQDQAADIARFVATELGNDTTANVVIMDTAGNMLYSGQDENSSTGSASSRLSYKTQYNNLVRNEINDALVGAKIYDNVQVVPNLDLNWDIIKSTEHTYTPAEGQDQGVLSQEDTYSQTTENSNGDIPGTDTNAEITYEFQDSAYSSSQTDETSRSYLPNEKITDTEKEGGAINYATSSIGITAIHYVVYNEEDMQASGALDGTTFDEFRIANSERTKTEVDEDVYNVVAAATGIPLANIQIVAYDEPVFVPSEGGLVSPTNIFIIVLIILILGLLAFVVIRSMRAERKAEEEEAEELSLDTLLQSTQDATELEEIDSESKSETRLLIEKFVDDNPEAVATLLRNWLTEDWG